MPFHIGFRSKIDLTPAGGTLSATTLDLAPIQANYHAEMALSESDGIDGRRVDTGCAQQLRHHAIKLRHEVVAHEFFQHASPSLLM
jgi:hypothetical protein